MKSSVTRTPTDTLMAAMDEFGAAEPTGCLIIWTDETGNLCWKSTSDSFVEKLGMVEFARTVFKKHICDEA